MRFVFLLVALGVAAAACSSSNSCPAVPLHCACGVDPVCDNGTWVCNCPDAGDASTD